MDTRTTSGSAATTDRRRWAPRLLVVASLAYSGVLLEAAVGYPLDPRRAYLSELAAADQPTRWLFRSADLLAGVLVVVAVVLLRGLARSGVGGRWRATAGRATLGAAAVFGAATVLDALAPMRCAQAASTTCARLLAGGGGGLLHEVHLVSSVVANVSAVAMALGVLVLALRSGRLTGRVATRAGAAVVAPTVVAGAAVLLTLPVAVLSLLEELDVPAPAGLGIVQRAQTVAFSLTLLFLGRSATPPDARTGSVASDDRGRPR